MNERGCFRAEDPILCERLVVAPRAGVFHPGITDVTPTTPEPVVVGDEIGAVVHMGEKYPVKTAFTGSLMGILVLAGERVRALQPVAWLTTDDES